MEIDPFVVVHKPDGNYWFFELTVTVTGGHLKVDRYLWLIGRLHFTHPVDYVFHSK